MHSDSRKKADFVRVVHLESSSLSVQVGVEGCGAFVFVWQEWSAVRVLDFVPGTHITISFEGSGEWAYGVTLVVLDAGEGKQL